MKVKPSVKEFAKNAKLSNVKAASWSFAKIRNINRNRVNKQEVNE